MTGSNTGKDTGKDSLFIQEVAGHQALYKKIIQLFHS